MKRVIDWLTCLHFSWLEFIIIVPACVFVTNWHWLPQAAVILPAVFGSAALSHLLRRFAGLPSRRTHTGRAS